MRKLESIRGEGSESDLLHPENDFGKARKKDEIGFSVVRGGNVVGEHSIKYFNGDERLEINHIANDRSIFAKGAIRSAIWTLNQKPGFFTLDYVLK